MPQLLGKIINGDTIHQERLSVKSSNYLCEVNEEEDNVTPREINRRLRIQLAAAHRGLAIGGFQDRIYNHLSVRAPRADGTGGDMMLITPPFTPFQEVTPSNLQGILIETGELVENQDQIYNRGADLHRGIFLRSPQTICVIHTHSPYIKVLASLEDTRLLMLEQTVIPLYNQIAYDNEYEGYTELEDGKKTGFLLGKDKRVVIQQNHGSVVVGDTVWEAYNDAITLEMGAENQIKAMQTGRKLKEIPDNICAKARVQHQSAMDIHEARAQLWNIITKMSLFDNEFKL